jgi:hypothetical protein|eukprot:COSAG06_NODE_2028_length_7800_cov_5036.112972_2_plen_88_part_00
MSRRESGLPLRFSVFHAWFSKMLPCESELLQRWFHRTRTYGCSHRMPAAPTAAQQRANGVRRRQLRWGGRRQGQEMGGGRARGPSEL